MGNRLTPAQWSIIKRDFPEIIESSTVDKLDFESRLFKTRYRRFKKKKTKIKKTPPNPNSSIINDTLLEILEWCEDLLIGDFYATAVKSNDDIFYGPRQSAVFYFAENADAIMFKLTWMNSKGIKDEE